MVIPQKRNSFGKRFGFARLKHVEDDILLAVRLDNIFIDTKIRANIPIFQRKKDDSHVKKINSKGSGGSSYPPDASLRSNGVYGGMAEIRSFLELVVNKEKQSKNYFKNPVAHLDSKRRKKTSQF